MIEAIHQFTSLIAMIPLALAGMAVLMVGLNYVHSYFAIKRRPTMWRNI